MQDTILLSTALGTLSVRASKLMHFTISRILNIGVGNFLLAKLLTPCIVAPAQNHAGGIRLAL